MTDSINFDHAESVVIVDMRERIFLLEQAVAQLWSTLNSRVFTGPLPKCPADLSEAIGALREKGEW